MELVTSGHIGAEKKTQGFAKVVDVAVSDVDVELVLLITVRCCKYMLSIRLWGSLVARDLN